MSYSTESHLVSNLAGVVSKQAAQLSAARGWQGRAILAIFALISISVWQRVGPLPAFVPLVADSFLSVMVLGDQVVWRVMRRLNDRSLAEIIRLLHDGPDDGALGTDIGVVDDDD